MNDVLDALRDRLGDDGVVADKEIVAGYLDDWTGRFHGKAVCVTRPADTKDVVAIMQVAKERSVPVVTQGGNTGLAGGAIPTRGGIILSTERLKSIELDSLAQVAKVGAGVTLSELNEYLAASGLRFAVDLASRDSATLGGMAATNAGGIHLIRFGGTRQQLLGVEAVLGGGQLISRMEGLQKDNSGYDWPSILCGSEGTLGVITRVAVKVVSKPRHRSVALVSLSSLRSALKLMSAARKRFSHLDAVEFMSESGLRLVEGLGAQKWPLTGDIPECALLFEVEGDEVYLDEMADFLGKSDDLLDSALAYDSRADALWYWREQHTVAIGHEGVPHKLDISIPLSVIPEFSEAVIKLLEERFPSARLVLFGHLADGNIHVNILNVDPDDYRIDHEIFRIVAHFGGSISAEHGIGRAKVRDLTLTRSRDDLDSMVAVKKALDPALVLNPGILFDL